MYFNGNRRTRVVHLEGQAVESITIRDFDEELMARLHLQAAFHGRSVEDEARDILRSALGQCPEPATSWAEAIHARFAAVGGVDLLLAPRESVHDNCP